MVLNSEEDQLFNQMAEEAMEYVAEQPQYANLELDNQSAKSQPRYTRSGFPLHDGRSEKVEPNGCYWEGLGKHQALYDKIWDEHVPDSGPPTTGGECAKIVYAIQRLLHENFNNGFGNGAYEFFDHYMTDTPIPSSEKFCGGKSWYSSMLYFLIPYTEAAAELLEFYKDNAVEMADEMSDSEDSLDSLPECLPEE